MAVNPKKLRPYDEPPRKRFSLIPSAPDSAAGAFLVVGALLRWAPGVVVAPPRWLVAGVVAASAVGALFAPGEPTGVAGIDALARAETYLAANVNIPLTFQQLSAELERKAG